MSELNVSLAEKSIGEAYSCYYALLDGPHCGCKAADKGLDEQLPLVLTTVTDVTGGDPGFYRAALVLTVPSVENLLL